jgi:ubiquinone/menaquinone biosynthesis C-methylase UbiE
MSSMNYSPDDEFVGGYGCCDGTVEFYSRVRSILNSSSCVLDLGAGRGSWVLLDASEYRKKIRSLKEDVGEYIGADVSSAVLDNPSTHRNVLIVDGVIPLEDQSVDIIICDFVFEHIVNVATFKKEVDRILKPGGYLCGRTPHQLCYVALAARLINNRNHFKWLRWLQPNRAEVDIFPTAYKCNTFSALKRYFTNYDHYSYIFTGKPQYYFGRRMSYTLFSWAHKVLPNVTCGNIFVFLRKH